MIAVDALTGEEYFQLKQNSKTEDVSDYFVQLCLDCVKNGFNKLTIILDNNSTHKKFRRNQLLAHLLELKISDKILVDFIDTPSYSPNFNLAEYIIHLLRLKLLHHLPLGVNMQQIQYKLEKYFEFNQLQTAEQIQNIIHHIYTLVNN